MIPLLAVMIGTYVVARCLDQLSRLAPRSEPLRALAGAFAVAAIVAAALCTVQIVLLGEDVGRATADAVRATDQLLR
jgi:hypothetical protein